MKTTILTVALGLASMSLPFAGAQTPAPATSGAAASKPPAAAATAKTTKKHHKKAVKKSVKAPAATTPAPAK
jgi:hypothetical protein